MNYSDERNEVGELEKMKLALIDLSERLYNNIRLDFFVDLIIFLLPMDRM